jgi:hypothetical protein
MCNARADVGLGWALRSCGLLTAGFILGVQQEGKTANLSMLGVLMGVVASVFTALNAIYTRRVMPAVGNNSWRLTFYNNVNCCVLFVPMMVLLGEVDVVCVRTRVEREGGKDMLRLWIASYARVVGRFSSFRTCWTDHFGS